MPNPLSLSELQAAFAGQVLGQGDHSAVLYTQMRPLPGWGVAERLSVHRNTSLITLTDALQALFPVVRRLVGDAFFAHLARGYLAAHAPQTPVLQQWGVDFTSFLQQHPGLDTVPYLPDIARLEWAWSQAQQAPEQAPLTATDLAEQAQNAAFVGDPLRLTLHGSATVLSSSWPVLSIWQVNQDDDPPELSANHAEQVLVVRPWQSVELFALSPAEALVLQALLAGHDLDRAHAEVLALREPFDLAHFISRVLASGWCVASKDVADLQETV